MTLLLALLLTAPADTTLPDAALGAWVNPDTVAIEMPIEEGGEPVLVLDPYGEPLQAFLYQSLDITDSTFTTRSVFKDHGDVIAVEWSATYTARGNVIELARSPPVRVDVEADSLVLSRPDQPEAPTYRYAREVLASGPHALVGRWAGDVMDGAGVPVGVSIEILPDGTFVSPSGEGPVSYRIAGSYLLIESGTTADATGTTLIFDVSRYELADNQLTLDIAGSQPLRLVRQ
ncbi:MAG: hypothetical protein Rubg2KO_10800 [Rubricoccaceae bacterium]